MISLLKKLSPIIIFLFFITSLIFFYFSEENVIHINKSRTSFSTKLDFNLENLPLLENDTFAIIEHSDDIENYKKKKKNYIFYDLIKNDEKSDNQ